METVFILLFAFLFLKLSKCLSEDATKDYVKKETTGVIDELVWEKGGGPFLYYVNFIDRDTGKAIRAESNYMATKSKQLSEGEEVKIIYYYTKWGVPYVIIIDDTLTTLESTTNTARNLKVISIILFIMAGYSILSRFIYMR